MAEPIPSPPGLPLVGNMYDVNPEDMLVSLVHLAEVYGMLLAFVDHSNRCLIR